MATTPNISTFELPQLNDLIDRDFKDALKSMDWELRESNIVLENQMPKNSGLFTRYAEQIDVNELAASRPEGDFSKQAKVQYGYEKDLEIKPFSLALGVTKLMKLSNKGGELDRMIKKFVDTVPNRMEQDLANRFSFFSSTSYVNKDGETVNITVGDGLAWGSTAHTLTGSGTTYTNIASGNPQFSDGALEALEKQFVEATYNNLGELMALKPDTIITTLDPNTCNAVMKLMNATADTTSSNSGTVNVYKNKYKHLAISRIATTAAGAPDTTKAKYWALAASDYSDFHLEILDSPYLLTPTVGGNGVDISSENMTYLSGAAYGICIVTGKWIRFSKWDWS